MLKKKLEVLLKRYETMQDQVNHEKDILLMEICELIADPAEKQYQTLDDDEAEFFETILDVTLDLNIPSILFEKLQSCCLDPSGALDKDKSAFKSIKILSSHIDILCVCLECLAHIASGSRMQTKAVYNLGMERYAEALALQREDMIVSSIAFKLLVCFISEDAVCGDRICQDIQYHTRANELFHCEHVTVNQKAWLVFFWDWTLYSSKKDFVPPDWIVNMSLSAACTQLQNPDLMSENYSLALLKTLVKKRFINEIDKFCPASNITYTMIEFLIPLLVSKLSHTDTAIVYEALLILGKIFQADCYYSCQNAHQIKLLGVAVDNGLLNHIIAVCQINKAGIMHKAMWLLSIIFTYEELYAVEFEKVYVLMPYICFCMRSTNYFVATRALFCLYDMFKRGSSHYLVTLINVVNSNLEIVPSIVILLNNSEKLQEDGKSQNPNGDEDYFRTVLDFGMHCLDSILYLGLLQAKGSGDHANNDINGACVDANVIQVLRRLKSMNLNGYDVNWNCGLQSRLENMLSDMKLVLSDCKIDVTCEKYADLFENLK